MFPGALARVLDERVTCRRCIQWEKLPERLGRRRGVRVPRGASVWPAAVDATFLENSSSARRGKGRTKNRTETKQGPPRGGTGGDTWALLLAREQAGWTNGHIPLFSPLTEGESYPHNSPLGFFPTRHRETWISAHVVTKMDYNQTYEQIEHGHTQTHIHTRTHTTVSTASWDGPSSQQACSRARGPERPDYVQGRRWEASRHPLPGLFLRSLGA